jgi:hypothetical protein
VAEGLQRNVVGAGVEMGADGLGDRIGRAVRDDGVDQAVAAAAGDVGLGEAEAQEVARVVRAGQVERGVLGGNGGRQVFF